MIYKVLVTKDAENDLDRFIRYLLFEKMNEQAASNLLDDFEVTKEELSMVTESIKLSDNPNLKEAGYRRINFLKHRYFMMYRLEGDTAVIDNIFHELQDYEKKMK